MNSAELASGYRERAVCETRFSRERMSVSAIVLFLVPGLMNQWRAGCRVAAG